MSSAWSDIKLPMAELNGADDDGYYADILGESEAASNPDEFQERRLKSDCVGKYFSCSECDQVFESEGRLASHIMVVHEKNKDSSDLDVIESEEGVQHFETSNHVCEECGKTFQTRIKARKHLRDFHKKSIRARTRKCKRCDFTTESYEEFYKHNKQHSQVMCSECGKVWSRMSYLNSHVKEVHEGRRFECSHCEASYKSKSKRNRHILEKHRGTQPTFTCELCNQTLLTEEYLINHKKRVHERPFRCNVCSYRAGRPVQLRKHMKNAHGIDSKAT